MEIPRNVSFVVNFFENITTTRMFDACYSNSVLQFSDRFVVVNPFPFTMNCFCFWCKKEGKIGISQLTVYGTLEINTIISVCQKSKTKVKD